MIYILYVFMMHGFYGPPPIEYAGQQACENAKAAILHAEITGVKELMCLPKSVAITPCSQDPKCSTLAPKSR